MCVCLYKERLLVSGAYKSKHLNLASSISFSFSLERSLLSYFRITYKLTTAPDE